MEEDINLPVDITSYGNYDGQGYGAHCMKVDIMGLTLYFSYQTVVAFSTKEGKFVSENIWSRTTGKHLSWIQSDKSRRLKHEIFTKLLKETLANMKWNNLLGV